MTKSCVSLFPSMRIFSGLWLSGLWLSGFWLSGFWLSGFWLGGLLLLGCSNNKTDTESDLPAVNYRVTVADPVLCDRLEELLDTSVDFYCPEVSEAGSLERKQIREIQDSELIVLDATHGSSRWSQQVSLPRAKVIFSTFTVLDQLIPVEKLATHTHGPGQAHSHSGIVSQTWLDPQLFGQQIDYILSTLKDKQLITEQEVSRANQTWISETAAINERLDKVAAQAPLSILVDQAGLEYLGRRMGWSIEIVVLENEIKSDPGLLKQELARWRLENPNGRMVLLNEPTPPLKALLTDLKESYFKLDIAATRFCNGKYFETLNEILDELTAEPRQKAL